MSDKEAEALTLQRPGERKDDDDKGDFVGDRAGNVLLVPLSAIKVDEKRNARTVYDEEYIEALAELIKAQGLLTPLTVDQDMNLWAGFCRMRALLVLHKTDKSALVKVTKLDIDTMGRGLLVNIGENTGRRNLSDYDLAKRLFELDDPEGKYAIKRSMIMKQTGLSKSTISALILSFQKSAPAIRKAWQDSAKGELKDKHGKPVQLPSSRLAQWTKGDSKQQAQKLEAFLDDDRPVIVKKEDEPKPSKSKGNGKAETKSKKSEPDEEVTRPPNRTEIRAEHDRLEERKKTSDFTETDAGRFQAIRWVLGIISRPY